MQTAFDGFPSPDASLLLLRLLAAATIFWLIPAALTRLFSRRWSASLRHRLWSMSTAAVLILPVLMAVLPDWRIARISAVIGGPVQSSIADASNASIHSNAVAPAQSAAGAPKVLPPIRSPQNFAENTDIPWAACAAIVWLVVCGWLIVRQLIAIAWAAGMLRRARVIPEEDAAAGKLRQLSRNLNCRRAPVLKTSEEISTPMCAGVARSCMVLPMDYASWPAAQLEAVLAHELAHAARRDVLWQAAARLACAIYWFHPLAWLAAWQMHSERELACDDVVLRSGQESTQYARLLVQLAEVIAALPKSAALAGVGMGSRHRLQQRVHALLDPARRRNSVSRLGAILLSTTGLAVVLLAAMLDPLAAPQVRAGESATQPAAAVLTPDVEQLLKDLATQESALQNLTIRAQSWDEFSPNEGRNDWQKDKSHTELQAWYVGSPMQQGRVDLHDDVRHWISGAAPYSEQSYSTTFDGKVDKYIKFLDGALGDVHEHHVATISATDAFLSGLHNDTGGSFSIYYFGRGKGISSFFRQYFATLRAHDPQIPITVTPEKYQGVDTLRLTIGAPAKSTENYWFDTARGLAFLGMRNRGIDHDGRLISSLEVHVNKLAEVGPKIWFPMEVDRYLGNWYPDAVDTTIGKRRASDTDSVRHRTRFIAAECKANDPNFNAAIFSPDIPQGFMVTDQVAKTSYPATKPKKVDPALEQMLLEKIGSN